MFAKTYDSRELIEILSAPSYAPELVAYCKMVEKEPLLGNFLERKAKLGVTGSIAKDYVEPDTPHAVPYITTKQVKGLIATLEDAKYISASADVNWAKCRVDDGDIIINKSGNVGAAAILNCAPYKYVNSVSDIINIKIKSDGKLDSAYLVVFLNSPYGQKQLQRLSGGAIFDHVSLHAIPNINVAYFDPVAQKYIGDKVRQAERLMVWAKRLLAMSDARISANFIYFLVDTMTEHPRWMPSKLVSEISLGPEFARGTEGQQTFKNAVAFADVIDSCKCGDPIKSEDRVAGRFPYYGASGPIDFHDEYNFDGTYLIVAQDGSIGCASVARGKIWANNHVWIVKINGQYDVDTIARYLDVHFPYWKGVTTGSVVPKVTAENLLRLKIPLDVAKDNLAGELLRTSGCATVAAKALTVVARLLVEALIEGKLTEQQLIDTQKALESDDNSLDRDILGRLTTKGLDGEGDPLFADLDQLYGLLAQCQPTDE